jgi:hypothetical protein
MEEISPFARGKPARVRKDLHPWALERLGQPGFRGLQQLCLESVFDRLLPYLPGIVNRIRAQGSRTWLDDAEGATCSERPTTPPRFGSA